MTIKVLVFGMDGSAKIVDREVPDNYFDMPAAEEPAAAETAE